MSVAWDLKHDSPEPGQSIQLTVPGRLMRHMGQAF